MTHKPYIVIASINGLIQLELAKLILHPEFLEQVQTPTPIRQMYLLRRDVLYDLLLVRVLHCGLHGPHLSLPLRH